MKSNINHMPHYENEWPALRTIINIQTELEKTLSSQEVKDECRTAVEQIKTSLDAFGNTAFPALKGKIHENLLEVVLLDESRGIGAESAASVTRFLSLDSTYRITTSMCQRPTEIAPSSVSSRNENSHQLMHPAASTNRNSNRSGGGNSIPVDPKFMNGTAIPQTSDFSNFSTQSARDIAYERALHDIGFHSRIANSDEAPS